MDRDRRKVSSSWSCPRISPKVTNWVSQLLGGCAGEHVGRRVRYSHAAAERGGRGSISVLLMSCRVDSAPAIGQRRPDVRPGAVNLSTMRVFMTCIYAAGNTRVTRENFVQRAKWIFFSL